MAELAGLAPSTALIVGSSLDAASRVEFAKAYNGVQVVERADMPELTIAASKIGSETELKRLNEVLRFARTVMSSIDQTFVSRLNDLVAGKAAPADDCESMFLSARRAATFGNLARMLECWSKTTGRFVYRPDLLSLMIDGMRRTAEDGDLKVSVLEVREAKRSSGRNIPALGIGSTLLLKGLEAERVILLDAGSMNACNAYVALSRASRSVTVISKNSVIGEARP